MGLLVVRSRSRGPSLGEQFVGFIADGRPTYVAQAESARTHLAMVVFRIPGGSGWLLPTLLCSAVFPFFWAWLWVSYRQRAADHATRLFLASVGIFLLTLLPWTIRNYQVFGRLMPVRDNFGLELWLGNHEGVSPALSTTTFRFLIPTNTTGWARLVSWNPSVTLHCNSSASIQRNFCGYRPGRWLHYWTAPDPVVWSFVSLMAWSGTDSGFAAERT